MTATAQMSRWQTINGVRINITMRVTPEFLEVCQREEKGYVASMVDLDDIAANTISNYLQVCQWLKAGGIDKAAIPTPAEEISTGDPIVTIWSDGLFTMHSNTNPVHAFMVAYAGFQNAARYTETPPPAQQSSARNQTVRSDQTSAVISAPERSESGTEWMGKFDSRQNYQEYDGQVVAFEIAQIAREYSRKGDVCWKFYPDINGRPGQYPIHGMTTYADNEKVPKTVRDVLDTVTGESIGPWRVVVKVAAKEDGKVSYYVYKIEAMARFEPAGPDVGDGENMPF